MIKLKKSLLVFSLATIGFAENYYQQTISLSLTLDEEFVQMQVDSTPLPSPLVAGQGYLFVKGASAKESIATINSKGTMSIKIPFQIIPETTTAASYQVQLLLLPQRFFGTGYTSTNFYQNQLLPIQVNNSDLYQYGQLMIANAQPKVWYTDLGLTLSGTWQSQNLISVLVDTKTVKTVDSLSFEITASQMSSMQKGVYWFQALLFLSAFQAIPPSTQATNLESMQASLQYMINQIKMGLSNTSLTTEEISNLHKNQLFLEKQIVDIQQTIDRL